MAERLSLLGVFAHPDDESFVSGGTLAKYAAEGVEVSLVCATKGEMGELGDPPLSTREELGTFREQELRSACKILGIRNLRFLGYLDGKLNTYNPNEIAEKIVRAIREICPQVVISFGPNGISGHQDHIAISRATTLAFEAAGDSSRYREHFEEGLNPWTPQKLYYMVLPQSIFESWGIKNRGVVDKLITTVIDVSEYLEVKIKAICCHQTQAKEYKRFLEGERRRPLDKEYFVLGISRLPRKKKQEKDLFLGLR